MKKLIKTLTLITIAILMLTGCNSNTTKPVETEDAARTTFEVVKKNNEQEDTLNLTDEEIDYAIQIAKPLTDNIVKYGFTLNNEEGQTKIEDYGIASMILAIWTYDSSYPYYDLFTYEYDGDNFQFETFTKVKLKLMTYQIFGMEDFDFGKYVDFDSQSQEYQTNVDFGINNQYSYDNLKINYKDSNIIEASFNLLGTNEGPGDFTKDLGIYKITYKIMKENNNIFLRYDNNEKQVN